MANINDYTAPDTALVRLIEDEVDAWRALTARYLDELRTRPGPATGLMAMLTGVAIVLCFLSLSRLDRQGIASLKSVDQPPGRPSKQWLKVLAKLQGHLRLAPLLVRLDSLYDDLDGLRWQFAHPNGVRALHFIFALLMEDDAAVARSWPTILAGAHRRSLIAIAAEARRRSRTPGGAGLTFSLILSHAKRSLASALREAAAIREELSDLLVSEASEADRGLARAEARAEVHYLARQLEASSRPDDRGAELLRQAASLSDPSMANLITLVQTQLRPGVGKDAAKKFVQRTLVRVREMVRRDEQRQQRRQRRSVPPR